MTEQGASNAGASGPPAEPERVGLFAWLRHAVGCPRCRQVLWVLVAHAGICFLSAWTGRRAIRGIVGDAPRPLIRAGP